MTEHSGWAPKVREAAVLQFSTEWGNALEQGEELKRTFDRLTNAMRGLAESGTHTTVVFEDELIQRWWVSYRAGKGDFVPQVAAGEPPAMEHEDSIVARHPVA